MIRNVKQIKSQSQVQVPANVMRPAVEAFPNAKRQKNGGCEITASTEKEDFSFKMNERSSFMLKLTCDENFNYKL